MVTERTAPTRAARARRPSPLEQFLEENENVAETLTERVTGSQGTGGVFTHTTARLVVLYFPMSWGWESREVPSTNIRLCIQEGGARYDCGDCKGDCSPDPMNPQYNNCSGRPKFATMQCPNCGKLSYDFDSRSVNTDLLRDSNPARSTDAEGTLLEDPALAAMTPTMRLSASIAQHMRRYHPDEAEARGLGREGTPAASLTTG